MPEGPLLKMPHTDGGETSGKYRNISPRSSSPVRQNIIQHILYYVLHFKSQELLNIDYMETALYRGSYTFIITYILTRKFEMMKNNMKKFLIKVHKH